MKSEFILFLFFVGLALTLTSCGGETTPEEEIREYLESIEKHVEERNAGRLSRYIADGYSDRYSYTKKDLPRIVAGYLLRQQQSVFIHHHIVAMELNESGIKAEVTVDVAVSKEELAKDDIRLLQGDFHRFAATLGKEDDDWLLQTLVWQSLAADKFMAP